MPRSCRPEFRRKILDLLKAGRTVTQLANDLQISGQTIYVWRRQEAIDNGELPGVTSTELAELSKALRRIAELEGELAIHRRAAELLKEAVPPKARYAAITTLAAEGFSVDLCWTCRCPAITPGAAVHHQPARFAMPGSPSRSAQSMRLRAVPTAQAGSTPNSDSATASSSDTTRSRC
ncbi:transposase [Actinoplanes sp. CA-252034]|uniref:transposase n=1 Tax=Actinoplanes sp. CA-252034 TaxID=3239906 RepID=UPI003D9699EE